MSKPQLQQDQFGNYSLEQIAAIAGSCKDDSSEQRKVVRWLHESLSEAASLIVDLEAELRHHEMMAQAILKIDGERSTVSDRVMPQSAIGQAVQWEKHRRISHNIELLNMRDKRVSERTEDRAQRESEHAAPVL